MQWLRIFFIITIISTFGFSDTPYVSYNFENNVEDQSGNGNHAILHGSGTSYTSTGKIGKGLRFDGNGYLSMPKSLIHSNPDFTISLYFKTTASNMAIMGYQNIEPYGTPSQWIPLIGITATGKLQTTLWTNGGSRKVISTQNVNDNIWHKVEMTANTTEGTLKTYLDNILIGSASLSVKHLNMQYNAIGYTYASAYFSHSHYIGEIDEFSFSTTALTPQTILFDPIVDQNLTKNSLALTATTTSNLKLTYKTLTPTICTISEELVSFLSSGTCTITVSQDGNNIFSTALPISRSFSILDNNVLPILHPIPNFIVYKNSTTKQIFLETEAINNDELDFFVSTNDTSLIELPIITNNTLLITPKIDKYGTTDITVTISDGELNTSKTFSFYIIPLEDGDDIEQVGNINTFEDENLTQTTATISNDLKVKTKDYSNGTVSHIIEVANKEIKATSYLPGSTVSLTPSGAHTSYNNTNIFIDINATILGEAIHTLTANNITTQAKSKLNGAQTTLNRDQNNLIQLITTVEIEPNSSIEVITQEDGSTQHKVITSQKTSKTISHIAGARTLIDMNGNVETSIGETIKALVVTMPNGKAYTKYIKIDQNDSNLITVVANTVNDKTPFTAGNEIEIDEISDKLYIKIVTSLENDLIIE